MTGTIKIGNAALCDYVGRGENNKHILLNVYSGDVLFTQYPPIVTFGLYIEYFISTKLNIEAKFELKSNGIVVGEVVTEFGPSDDDQYAVFALQQFPLSLSGDAIALEVWLSAPGFRNVCALKKRIRKLTQSAFASAIKQPSTRSQTVRRKRPKQP